MNIVINSQFKPFSYQELVAPILQATQEHQNIEQAAAELESNAELWRSKIKDEDVEALALYNNYHKKLADQAEDLAKNGLNVHSRRQLYKLKADYNREILPIETSYKKRAELIKMGAEMSFKDPTARFSFDPRKLSLDQLIKDPDMMFEMESGNRIVQLTSQIASKYASSYMNSPEKLKNILPHQYMLYHQNGATPQAFLAALAEEAKGNPKSLAAQAMARIRSEVKAQSRVSGWQGDEAYMMDNDAWLDNNINIGLHSMIGETKMNVVADQFTMDLQKMKFNHMQAQQANQQPQAVAVNIPINVESYIDDDELKRDLEIAKKEGYIDVGVVDEKTGAQGFKAGKKGGIRAFLTDKITSKLKSAINSDDPIKSLMNLGFSKAEASGLYDSAERLQSRSGPIGLIMDKAVPVAGNSISNNLFGKGALDPRLIKLGGTLGEMMYQAHLNKPKDGKNVSLTGLINDFITPEGQRSDIGVTKGFLINLTDGASDVVRSSIGGNMGISEAKVDSKTKTYVNGNGLNPEKNRIGKIHSIRTLGGTVAVDADVYQEKSGKFDDKPVRKRLYIEAKGNPAITAYAQASERVRMIIDQYQAIMESNATPEMKRAKEVAIIRQLVQANPQLQGTVIPENVTLNTVIPMLNSLANKSFMDSMGIAYRSTTAN